MVRAPEGANPAVRAPAGGKGTAAQLLVLVLAAVAVVSLVPAWPTPTTPVDTALPAFFTSPAANEIPAGSVVLTYPLAITPEDQAMLWQETDRYRWKLVGGYALIPNRHGLVSARPPELTPFAVQHFLAWEDVGGRGLAAKRPPALDRHLVAELRVYIRRYGIGTVILDPIGSGPSAVRALFEWALGAPRRLGGVDCWFDAGRARPRAGPIPRALSRRRSGRCGGPTPICSSTRVGAPAEHQWCGEEGAGSGSSSRVPVAVTAAVDEDEDRVVEKPGGEGPSGGLGLRAA